MRNGKRGRRKENRRGERQRTAAANQASVASFRQSVRTSKCSWKNPLTFGGRDDSLMVRLGRKAAGCSVVASLVLAIGCGDGDPTRSKVLQAECGFDCFYACYSTVPNDPRCPCRSCAEFPSLETDSGVLVCGASLCFDSPLFDDCVHYLNETGRCHTLSPPA